MIIKYIGLSHRYLKIISYKNSIKLDQINFFAPKRQDHKEKYFPSLSDLGVLCESHPLSGSRDANSWKHFIYVWLGV